MTKKIGIFYFSLIPYNFLYQRPQQLYSEWKRNFGDEFEFFYVESPNPYSYFNKKSRSINDPNVLRLPFFTQIKILGNCLYNAFKIVSLNDYFDYFDYLDKKVAILSTPLWEPHISKEEFEIICYDYLDSLKVQLNDKNQENLESRHIKLILKSDIIFITAEKLKKEVSSISKDANVVMVSNGVNINFFEDNIKKVKIEPFTGSDKVVGYVGILSEWIDTDLLFKTAHALPEVDFIFVGPVHDENKEKYLNNNTKNVFFIGEKPYKQIPSYINLFDVALIPFKMGDIADSTDPIKVYEYFAVGKPVVSTNLRELKKFNKDSLLRIAKNDKEFVDSIKYFLYEHKNGHDQRKKIAKKNSWSNKAGLIIEAIKKELDTL